MKRYWIILACLAGVAAFLLLLPLYDARMPRGLSTTRAEARKVADVEARKLGIEVDKAWVVTTWEGAPHIELQFRDDPALRKRATQDPVVGPRLGGFRTTYFRPGQEKFPEFGFVVVGVDGKVLAARRRSRIEVAGANPKAADLEKAAHAFVASRSFPGAPNPKFEDARPNVLRNRTDHSFRYRTLTDFPTGQAIFYLYVYYVGDKLAGWELIEETKDGSQFRFETGNEIMSNFFEISMVLALVLIFLIFFLKKYHAGEVGVGVGAFLFAAMIVLQLLFSYLVCPPVSYGTNFGSIDASSTAWVMFGFKFLFYDIPVAVLVFLAWSVGESFARERWGEKLVSFDAVLRRNLINATVGRSILAGALLAPLIPASSYLVGLIPVLSGKASPQLNAQQAVMLFSSEGGALTVVLSALINGLVVSVVGCLAILAAMKKRRALLPLAIIFAAYVSMQFGAAPTPLEPTSWQIIAGFGGGLAAALIFLSTDLLATVIAVFGGVLMMAFVPILTIASGNALYGPIAGLTIPLSVVLLTAIAGLFTGRELVYTYEDLAPHVRRIIERERVKAEIDAANRIQAALLPDCSPDLTNASVSAHYRAATEIGGDYYDFLPLADGNVGFAFGDVSGHGLTSGIIMSMAKAALLVQVEYDASPTRVMEILNDVVMKTAPKRMLMTFFFGILDSERRILRFSSAGHHDPYVYRARTRHLDTLSSWGFPLGVKRREPFRELIVQFEPGDRLILYSDGFIEAVDDDGEPYGFDRFEKTFTDAATGSAEDIKRALLNSVKKFTRNRPPEDDQTLVVVSFDEAGEMREEKAS
jgi:hypothetical protein